MRTPGSTIGFGANRITKPNYAFVPAPDNTPPIFGPTSPVVKRIPTQFQNPPITSVQGIDNSTISDKLLLVKVYLELSKLILLLRNLKLQYDNLLRLLNYYYDVTPSLTTSIRHTNPILPHHNGLIEDQLWLQQQ